MRWRELLHLNQTHPLPQEFFDSPRRVHFIGVGGIGMSALALLLKARGHEVSGSDASESALSPLREAGIRCFVGQKADNLGESEAIFYSSAIAADNPELAAATAQNLPLWHRAQLLAFFVNGAKTSIAVSGTHGKSSTSAMIAHILTETGHNPTAILGAIYPPFESNLRVGDPDLIVVEADESDGSFTLLEPTVAVVLNVEAEHLENYDESEAELWRAFEMFVEGAEMPVLCADDAELCQRIPHDEYDLFGLEPKQEAIVFASNVRVESGKIHFEMHYGAAYPTYLTVPGRHNVSNAAAAVLSVLNIEESPFEESDEPSEAEIDWLLTLLPKFCEPLQTFAGTLRRFERKGEANGIAVYDDYGHHPTEVRATLDAALHFLERPIAVVFQPHRYSRTLALHREFGSAFESAEKIVITQLYSAFEEPIAGVSGRMVYEAVREKYPLKDVFYAENLVEAKRIALQILEKGDALITMGAGDITQLGPQILEALAQLKIKN